MKQGPISEAIRLLGGTGDEVVRGIGLIDSAATRGDADALERKALLEAVGCGRPQSWESAFDCLAQAAEHGSPAAQAQLRILAGDEGNSEGWNALRSSLSLEELLRPPEKNVLSEAPRLHVLKSFATPAECTWLMQRASARLAPATVITESGEQTVKSGRTNKAIAFQLADMDLVVEIIRARISAATRLPLPIFETSQVLHYSPGQEFTAHHDYLDPANPAHAELLRSGQRIATFLVYLNDAYTEGQTTFPRAGLSFRGEVGDALFISNVERNGRPDPMTLHAGTPPGSGEKWIFSQWIRDRLPASAAPRL